MKPKKLETIGAVSKKETLVSADMNCNHLILETSEPFPGYHGANLPPNLHTDSLFMVTKLMYNDEKIIRSIQQIKAGEDHPEFDGTPGTVHIYNKPVGVIRIKETTYDKIPALVKLFEETGIEFKKKKKISPYQSIIKIRKFFKMHMIEDGIYQDDVIPQMHYLAIPKNLRWQSFEKITMDIKYNIDDNNFDAALVYVFYEEGIMDLVRIFDLNSSLKKLKCIREKYLEKID
jgi:hypothetical protein